MWGCKTLHQNKVFQPRNRPNQGFSSSKGNGSYSTIATYKIMMVLPGSLLRSRVESSESVSRWEPLTPEA